MPTVTGVRVFQVGDLVMLMGGDRSDRLLEVGLAAAEGIEFIVHAMPARSKFVRRWAAGLSWARVGEILGTSAQAAQQRYGEIVERV